MAAKKKKDMSWDDIGKAIGSKIEKCSKDDKCNTWNKQFMWHKECRPSGGGFGRLLFIIGIMVALNINGYLDGLSWWINALIIVGFTFMKF